MGLRDRFRRDSAADPRGGRTELLAFHTDEALILGESRKTAPIEPRLDVAVAHALEIDHRRGDVAVAHPLLQRADIYTVLEVAGRVGSLNL